MSGTALCKNNRLLLVLKTQIMDCLRNPLTAFRRHPLSFVPFREVDVELGPVIGMFSLLFSMHAHGLMMKEVWNVINT